MNWPNLEEFEAIVIDVLDALPFPQQPRAGQPHRGQQARPQLERARLD